MEFVIIAAFQLASCSVACQQVLCCRCVTVKPLHTKLWVSFHFLLLKVDMGSLIVTVVSVALGSLLSIAVIIQQMNSYGHALHKTTTISKYITCTASPLVYIHVLIIENMQFQKRRQAQLTRLHRQLQEAQARRRQWGKQVNTLQSAVSLLRQKLTDLS